MGRPKGSKNKVKNTVTKAKKAVKTPKKASKKPGKALKTVPSGGKIKHTFKVKGGLKTKYLTPEEAIYRFCEHCNGWWRGIDKIIEECETTDCPIWAHRLSYKGK